MFSGETRSVDNWRHHASKSADKNCDSYASDESTNWSVLFSGVKTLGKWFLHGLRAFVDFTEVLMMSPLNDTYTGGVPHHKLKHVFGDPFPMSHWPSGIERSGASWLMKSGHDKFLSTKPPDVPISRY